VGLIPVSCDHEQVRVHCRGGHLMPGPPVSPDSSAWTVETLSGRGQQFIGRGVDYVVDSRIDPVMPAAKQAKASTMGRLEQVGRDDVHQRDLRACGREQARRIDTGLPCSFGHPDEDRVAGRF
jgi:hypothetical protein